MIDFKNGIHFANYVSKVITNKGLVPISKMWLINFYKTEDYRTVQDFSYMCAKVIQNGKELEELFANPYDYIFANKQPLEIKVVSNLTILDIDLMENLLGKSGVYMLHDDSMEIKYIGRSTDLGNRILSSLCERKLKTMSYCITKTKSDAMVYEMYYINKIKPEYNLDGKHEDELTIELPELKFTKPVTIVL